MNLMYIHHPHAHMIHMIGVSLQPPCVLTYMVKNWMLIHQLLILIQIFLANITHVLSCQHFVLFNNWEECDKQDSNFPLFFWHYLADTLTFFHLSSIHIVLKDLSIPATCDDARSVWVPWHSLYKVHVAMAGESMAMVGRAQDNSWTHSVHSRCVINYQSPPSYTHTVYMYICCLHDVPNIISTCTYCTCISAYTVHVHDHTTCILHVHLFLHWMYVDCCVLRHSSQNIATAENNSSSHAMQEVRPKLCIQVTMS